MMIGEFIKAERKRAGLTQDQLGSALNVSRRTVVNWELGKGVTWEVIEKLAERFGCRLVNPFVPMVQDADPKASEDPQKHDRVPIDYFDRDFA